MIPQNSVIWSHSIICLFIIAEYEHNTFYSLNDDDAGQFLKENELLNKTNGGKHEKEKKVPTTLKEFEENEINKKLNLRQWKCMRNESLAS